MKRRLIGLAVLGLAGVVGSSALAAAPAAYQRPGQTSVVSTGVGGAAARYPATDELQCDTGAVDMTPDGHYVVFDSSATNLVAGDTNNVCDVFRKDLRTGKTVRVSVAADGTQTAVGRSQRPSISDNGRYVAFDSKAGNLVPGNTNLCVAGTVQNRTPYCLDVYVKDLLTGRITRASVSSTGAQAKNDLLVGGDGASGASSSMPSLSADGQVVSFHSNAVNFASKSHASGFNYLQVYVHNIQTRRTVLASVSSTGAAADRTSEAASLSGNGRFVMFESAGRNLDPGHPGAGTWQVYVRDLRAGTTKLASVASDGSPASFGSIPACSVSASVLPVDLPPPADLVAAVTVPFCESNTLAQNMRLISHDGHYVVFSSNATNLVPNDKNFRVTSYGGVGGFDVFLHDMWNGRTERISVDQFGHELKHESLWPQISANGRYVSFAQTDRRAGHMGQPRPSGPCVPDVLGSTPFSSPSNSTECQGIWSMLMDRTSGAPEQVDSSMSGGTPTGARCSADQLQGSYAGFAKVGRPSPDGRFVPFWSNASNVAPAAPCQYFIRDRGPAAGVGSLGSASRAGTGGPTATCIADEICLPPLPAAGSVAPDAGMVAVRLVRRSAQRDVFIRWDLQRLLQVSGSPSGGVLYGTQFSVGGQRYEVRAQRAVGPDYDSAGGASFGLFREALPGVWTHVAALKGGYGTVGDAVVTAVPLALLGGKADLTDVTAYTAVGSYLAGATKVLDSLRLSR